MPGPHGYRVYQWPPPGPQWTPPKRTTGLPAPGAPYHRLGRTDRYRWWKPLLALPVILIGVVVASVALLIPMFIVDGALSGGMEPPGDALMNNPILDVAALLASVAVALPAVLLTVWLIEGRKPGWVSSVAGRLRWRWLGQCTLVIAPLVVLGFAAFVVVGMLVEPDLGDTASTEPIDIWLLVGGLVVTFALVPVQAAAEEYMFRGYLLQWIGSALRNPLFGVAITSVLFALAHADLQWSRLVSLTAFGAVAAMLALYTGGLEASIVLHTVNNLLAFGLGALAGAPPTGDPTATEMPWWMAAVDVFMVASVLVVVLLLARRKGLASKVAEPPQPPAKVDAPPAVGSPA